MVAVRVLIPYPSDLTELHMRVCTLVSRAWSFLERWSIWVVTGLPWNLTVLLCEILAREKKHLLMEATDDWNFGLCRGCLRA